MAVDIQRAYPFWDIEHSVPHSKCEEFFSEKRFRNEKHINAPK